MSTGGKGVMSFSDLNNSVILELMIACKSTG